MNGSDRLEDMSPEKQREWFIEKICTLYPKKHPNQQLPYRFSEMSLHELCSLYNQLIITGYDFSEDILQAIVAINPISQN